MFKQTALTSLDSYKLAHADMYPAGTTKVYSNFTARSNKYFNFPNKGNKIVWFGLQALLQEMNSIWKETFFDQPIDEVCKEFSELVAPFVGEKGFNVDRLRELHYIGYLPLDIKALSEGSLVNIGVPVLTITNTIASAYWLPNFLETWLSSELWKSSTSATISHCYRKLIDSWADKTGGAKEFVQWQGHDFSLRGTSGIRDGAKSGAGHLISFTGTDNIAAVKLINDCYYGKNTFVGGSVPASEHSVMCAGGEESEIETFSYILKTYPTGVVSIVSDSWDYWNVITNMAQELKEEILARQPDALGLAKTVFRPDSGDPVKIICGDPDAPVGSPEHKGSVVCLDEIFGSSINSKGFKTLNPRVGLIYGDSITYDRAERILSGLAEKGYASDNIVFGIGSYTFQYNTRDTLGFAMKATYVEIDGVGKAIFKNPKTDDGTKKSAKGLLKVERADSGFVLLNDVTPAEERSGCLKTVFFDGYLSNLETFESIRERLNKETYE